jgi:hypothetical protein
MANVLTLGEKKANVKNVLVQVVGQFEIREKQAIECG